MKMKLLAAGLALCATSAFAQYPNKPITTVVGFAPGGGTDTVSRIVAKTLGDQLGQQVLTDNRAGAGGNIATDFVVRSAPDGYTLYLANAALLSRTPAKVVAATPEIGQHTDEILKELNYNAAQIAKLREGGVV